MIQDEELREEWLDDMRQEAKEEEGEENKMHEDYDYAFKALIAESEDLMEIHEIVLRLQRAMEDYGHDCPITEIIGEL